MSERRYRLGPREARGTVAGWRAGQVICVVAALGVVLVVFMISTAVPALLFGVATVAVGLAGAVVPVCGRTTEEWIPVLVHHARHRHRTQRCEVRLVVHGSHAALHLDHRLVVVLELAADGFALLEGPQRDRLVEGFSASLGQLARSRSIVERVGWSVGIAQGSVELLERDRRRRAVGPLMEVEAYATLLDEIDARLPERRVQLFLTTGLLRGVPEEYLDEVLEEARTVAVALERTGHPHPRICGATDLHRVLDEIGAREATPEMFIVEMRSSFDHVSDPTGCAVSWWVADWPRHEVSAEALSALLLGEGQRRMAVVFEPVDPHVALRRAQVASTKGAADAELRRQGGFLADRRRTAEANHRAVREEELVSGHQGLRFSGFISVHMPDVAGVEAEARATELLAAQAGLSLRRLQGDHHRGRLATFPLGRGLS